MIIAPVARRPGQPGGDREQQGKRLSELQREFRGPPAATAPGQLVPAGDLKSSGGLPAGLAGRRTSQITK
jgi:hypothetical protein